MLRQTFHPTGPESAPRKTNPARTVATILRAMGDAWREALAAHRQYVQLTSRGVAHDPALKQALGFRIPAGEVRRSKPHTGHWRRGEAQIGNLTFVR
jgi:hypothetical protein